MNWNWRTALGITLAIAAALCGWSAWNHRDRNEAAEPTGQRPDYVMHNFVLTALDEQGRESVTLRAPLLERNPDDETMTLTTPLFELPNTDGQYWNLRSRTGWVSAKGDELRLRGNVLGTSPEGVGTPTTLRTNRLNIYPNKHLARTQDKVTVTQPGSILEGVGFEVNTQSQHYIFKSQVKSRYAPKTAR